MRHWSDGFRCGGRVGETRTIRLAALVVALLLPWAHAAAKPRVKARKPARPQITCPLAGKELDQARRVTAALEAQGVRELPLFSDSAGTPITNHDDLIRYWTCLANFESGAGAHVDGLGGKGLLSVSKGHIRRKVSATNPENGKIYRCSGDLRNSWERNISCAFALYLVNRGFRDWGPPQGTWGANWRCTPSVVACFPAN